MPLKKKFPRRKRAYRKPTGKVSKPLRRAIKQVMKTQVETKTINCPDPAGVSNSVATPYGALSGLQYLVQDVFKLNQGVLNSTAIAAGNRIGDKVKGVGFLMDYYFRIINFYVIGSNTFYLPYVKLRITLFTQAFGIPPSPAPLVYDTNFLNSATSTLQPINWDEGYVKTVLYDKVHIIRNTLSLQGNIAAASVSPLGQVFHFKKYVKYDHLIKYMDNNTGAPNNTDKPVYLAISAEVDDSLTGSVPSGTKILYTTGYTRAWFKDA